MDQEISNVVNVTMPTIAMFYGIKIIMRLKPVLAWTEIHNEVLVTDWVNCGQNEDVMKQT
jgi:hypothetical protein